MAQKQQLLQQLRDVGSKLESPPPSKDALIKLLKQIANYLSELDQLPSPVILEAMKPSQDALAKAQLLKSLDKDIKVLVATCICEITRITAPEPPYSDEVLRDIFQLFVWTFSGLGDVNSPSFGRRVVILETLARYRLFLMMLDLDCNNLINEMFRTFFAVVSDNHPENVLGSMRIIMTLILNESEDVEETLIFTILSSLGHKEGGPSPAAHNLAVKVIEHCSRKLETPIKQFLLSSISGDPSASNKLIDYHEVIYNMYQCAPQILFGVIPYITGELLTDKVDVRLKAVNLLGSLFALPGISISESFKPLFSEFLKRLTDRVVEVRLSVVEHAKNCLISDPSRAEAADIISALRDRLLDYDEHVRKQVVTAIYDVACHKLSSIPSASVRIAAERLRDKSVSVRQYTIERLAEVYRLYCQDNSGVLVSDNFEWIPGKILRCLYDKDFRSDMIEGVLCKSLFPPEFSVKDKVQHWIAAFSWFDKVEVKAFEQMLMQKQRLQHELQKYLSLRQTHQDGDGPEHQKKLSGCFRTMARFFNDPVKTEESFQLLNQLKDANIWRNLSQLLDPAATYNQSWTYRDELLRILGEKHPLYDFTFALSLKSSFLLVNKEIIKEILGVVASSISDGNIRLETCMKLLAMETPPTNVASGGDSSFYVPPRSTDPAWQFGYLSNRADSNTVTCRLCKKVVKGGIYRFKQHLAHRKGNVAACPKVDEETKKLMISYLDDVARKKSQKAIEVSEMRDEIDIGIAGDAGSAKRHRSSESLEQNVAVQGTRQMSIKDALSKDHRERVVSYICNWAYTSAIPFNAFTTKQFKQMVEAIGMYGPGLKTPTRYEISGPFLKKAVKKISDDLQCHRITWKKTGCSIMTDAWTDMRGRSIMNFCVNCSLGTSFLKSIDASDETHTADYIFQLVDECINEVGVDSVVQVVADNASANVAAWRLLLTKYPQIWWTSCAAHSIDRALEEISRDSKVKSAVKKARTLTIFIYAHTKTLSLMRKFTNKRDIARPGQTRFATTFLTLESILEKKDKLRLMFSSDEWRACKWYKTKKGEQAASIVFSPTFWNHTAFAIKIFTPLVRLLRVVDADCRPSMGFVYGGLEEAKREIIASLNSVESSYKFFVDAIISKTKGRLDTPLHLAAYFLNPYFFFTECGGDVDIVVKRGFMDCMERFYPDLDIQDAITTKELLDYRHGRGAFGKPLAVRQRMRNDENFDPANWWYNYGDDAPHLKDMAIKILSLTSASSGCERNWSTFDSVLACYFPMHFSGFEEDLISLLKEDNDMVKEGIAHVLAKAGGIIREKLTTASSSVELLLERLCLEGSRKQAKYAVQALAAITKDDGLKSLSVLYKRLVDLLEERTHLPSILQSLGSIAQHAMPIFETREREILDFVSNKILQCGNKEDYSKEKFEWTHQSELCKLKIFGLKVLAKSFMPVKDAHLRTDIEKLLEVIQNILLFGEITKDIDSSPVDKAHMRFAAAKALLRLSKQWDHKIPVDVIYLAFNISQDTFLEARKLFKCKIHQYIKERSLDAKYACAFLYNIVESHPPGIAEDKHNLMEIIQMHHQLKVRQLSVQSDLNALVAYPEYILPWLVHALAHHPFFPDIDGEEVKSFEPVYWRLHMFLSALLLGDENLQSDMNSSKIKESFTAVASILHSIKLAEDSVDKSKVKNSQALCDLGLSIAKHLVNDHGDVNEVKPTVPLPGEIYKQHEADGEPLASREQSWLGGATAFAYFKSLLLKNDTSPDAIKSEPSISDVDIDANNLPLGTIMKSLKLQAAKRKKVKANASGFVNKKSQNEVDVLGVVREINLGSSQEDENMGDQRLAKEDKLSATGLVLSPSDKSEHLPLIMNITPLSVPKRKRSSFGSSPKSAKDRKKSQSLQFQEFQISNKEEKVASDSDLLVTCMSVAKSVVSGGKRIGTHQNTNGKACVLENDNLGRLSLPEKLKRKTRALSAGQNNRKRKRKSIAHLEKCSQKIVENSSKLVGCMINVWWPLDKKYYKGKVQSYDEVKKKHVILYDDGDVEVLRLDKERWKLVDSDQMATKIRAQDPISEQDMSSDGSGEASRRVSKKKSGSEKSGKTDEKRIASMEKLGKIKKTERKRDEGLREKSTIVSNNKPGNILQNNENRLGYEEEPLKHPEDEEMIEHADIEMVETSSEEADEDSSNCSGKHLNSDDEPLTLWRQRIGK